MLRPWFKLVLLLTVVFAMSVWANIVSDGQQRRARIEASKLVSFTPHEILPEHIAIVELLLPGSKSPVKYVRDELGWRISTYRNAFAVTDGVEGLIKSALNGRGLPVGTEATNDVHFGLLPHKVLTVRLGDAQQTPVLELLAGDIPPGQQQDECYVLVNGQPTVYLFTENLWRALGAPLPRGLPPLADEHVFARALHVGTPKRLTFAGERVPEVTQITRTDLPIDPKSMDPRRGREQKPTVEWHGTFADGRRELLDDAKMGPYVHGLISLKFEELLGELSPRDAERLEMDNPLWSAILEQDKGESFTLVMSRIQAGQQRTVVNMATKQMFSITNETADTLLDVPVVVKTEEEDQGSETDAGEAQTEDSGQAAELRNR